MSYPYYNRRKYYRRSTNSLSPFDMLLEIIWSLIKYVSTLIVILIVKLWNFLFNHKVKGLFKLNEDNLHVPEESVSELDINQTSSLKRNENREEISYVETKENTGRYNLKDSFLTEAEDNFLIILKQVVGERYIIEPQVSLSRLVAPKDSNGRYTNYSDFNKIKSKSVDFVLFTNNYKPQVVIELDDRSHFRLDRIKRDEFVNNIMNDVGLRIVRVPTAYSYDIEGLTRQIFG